MSVFGVVLLLASSAPSSAEVAASHLAECFKTAVDARVAADWPPMTTLQPAGQICEKEMAAAKAEVIDTIHVDGKSYAVSAGDVSAMVFFEYVMKLEKDKWVRSRAKSSWQRYTEEMDDDEHRLRRQGQITWSNYHKQIRWHAESLYFPKGQLWVGVSSRNIAFSDPDHIIANFVLGGTALVTDGLGQYPYSEGERVFFFFRPVDQRSGKISWTRIVVAQIGDDDLWHIISARERWRCASTQSWTVQSCETKK